MGKAVKGAPSNSRSWRGTRPFPSFCRNALRKQSLKGFYSGASGQRRALAISLAEQETREVYPALLGASGQRGFEQPAVIKGNQTIFRPFSWNTAQKDYWKALVCGRSVHWSSKTREKQRFFYFPRVLGASTCRQVVPSTRRSSREPNQFPALFFSNALKGFK